MNVVIMCCGCCHECCYNMLWMLSLERNTVLERAQNNGEWGGGGAVIGPPICLAALPDEAMTPMALNILLAVT